ncbi:MAG: flagellar export protein FliJ [Opitutaceae bacterium]
MKPFRFRLEPVVTLRNWEEERARTAYGQALGNEQRVAAQMKEIEAHCEAELAACRAAVAQPISAVVRAQQWKHLTALDRQRADAAQKLASTRRIREQKMKLLIEAHRRVRVLEALRARQQHAHRAAALQHEERELGDIAAARHQTRASIL